MAKNLDQNNLYYAKLEAVKYIANNWWRFLLSHELDDREVRSVSFAYPDYASMPEEVYTQLRPRHLHKIESVMSEVWEYHRDAKQQYDLDDLLFNLDWQFNPTDIQDIKIQYNEPKYKKRKGKK